MMMNSETERGGGRVRCFPKAALLLAVAALTGSAPMVPAGPVDTDRDGMSDGFELFYGLDPEEAFDAGLNPDGDTLVNVEESVVGTDPFAGDTDWDGWADGVDAAPVSRAVLDWGEGFFTRGDTLSYVAPAWLGSAFKEEGEWDTEGSCWHVSGSEPEGTGSLNIDLDRSLLAGDLRLAMQLWDSADSTLFLDLYDTNDVAVATDLAGDLTAGSEDTVTRVLRIPLSEYQEAVGIRLRRGEGELRVYCSVLYVDEDGDGLDAEQEEQLGTSDTDADSDADGLTDFDEVFAYGTDPGAKPVVSEKAPAAEAGGADRLGEGLDRMLGTQGGGSSGPTVTYAYPEDGCCILW
jgi:hypothetical protein